MLYGNIYLSHQRTAASKIRMSENIKISNDICASAEPYKMHV